MSTPSPLSPVVGEAQASPDLADLARYTGLSSLEIAAAKTDLHMSTCPLNVWDCPDCAHKLKEHRAILEAVKPRIEEGMLREAYLAIRGHAAAYRAVPAIKRHREDWEADGRRDAEVGRQVAVHEWYARGLEAAARDIAERLGVPEHEIEEATALEQAQPLLAAGSEVESLEPVESPVIDMGFLSLPAELQAEAERAASGGQERSEEGKWCDDEYAGDSHGVTHSCGLLNGHAGSHLCRCTGLESYTWPAEASRG